MTAIERFVQYERYELNRSPHTVAAYRGDLEQFRSFLSRGGADAVEWGTVSVTDVRAWLVNRADAGDCARTLHTVRSLSKLLHVIAQTSNETRKCRHVGRSEELSLLVGSRTEVYSLLHKLLWSLIPLELTTPESTKVNIYLAIIILKHTWVDTH